MPKSNQQQPLRGYLPNSIQWLLLLGLSYVKVKRTNSEWTTAICTKKGQLLICNYFQQAIGLGRTWHSEHRTSLFVPESECGQVQQTKRGIPPRLDRSLGRPPVPWFKCSIYRDRRNRNSLAISKIWTKWIYSVSEENKRSETFTPAKRRYGRIK